MDDLTHLPADSVRSEDTRPPKEKVREFPETPGVYLMKDERGRVIYVGKARNLRSRAGSYFTETAAHDRRTAELVRHIADIDRIDTDSEVDALLLEARLIKDIQPRFNIELKDDKSFPYLQIITSEDFPRVEFTRKPSDKGVRLYGPFAGARSLRGAIQVMQRIFRFRTCDLDIDEGDPRWRHYRPCILASINQCTAPCNERISKEEYRKDIHRLRQFLEGGKTKLLAELRDEMQGASKALEFEKAARLRDEIHLLETLNLRGDLETHEQPEVFFTDPKKGLKSLKKALDMESLPRSIEGIDIAHLGGEETVASLVHFLDGVPFKPSYKRFRIKTVTGVDDFASIREVVLRRFRPDRPEEWLHPDLLMIDGGKGQLAAALDAFRELGIRPPPIVSLAKREEEIFTPGSSEPIRLSRHNAGLRLLQAVRDEAHRFARHYHHLLRRKKTLEEKLPPTRKRRRRAAEAEATPDVSSAADQTPEADFPRVLPEEDAPE
jgi:excinuclease ABC subunit C